MREHFLKESDLEKLCGGCGEEHGVNSISKWDEHSPFIHYKTGKCQHCKYEILIRTDYDCSGL